MTGIYCWVWHKLNEPGQFRNLSDSNEWNELYQRCSARAIYDSYKMEHRCSKTASGRWGCCTEVEIDDCGVIGVDAAVERKSGSLRWRQGSIVKVRLNVTK